MSLLAAGCGSIPGAGKFGPSQFTLNVTSVNPPNAVPITVTPADVDGAGSSSSQTPLTGLSLVYNPGTVVTLTAPPTQHFPFYQWVGCDSTSGLTCTVTMTGDKAVQAQYNGVTSIVVTPINPIVGVPSATLLNITVNGIGDQCIKAVNPDPPTMQVPFACQGSPVNFTSLPVCGAGVAAPSGCLTKVSDSTYFYETPFPAPTSPQVTISLASLVSPEITAETVLTLNPALATAGPLLSVDLGSPTHTISPYIYGVNDYDIPPALPALIDLPIERWGGDMTTRYNYTNDSYNSAGDFYFENNPLGTGGYPDTSEINTQLTTDKATNTKALVTVPLIGYTTNRNTNCSYSVAKYGPQKVVDPNKPDCGNGYLSSNGNQVTNDPTDTSYAIDQTFDSGWVNFLTGKFGTAANGGVAMYALDNEPEYWDGVHMDVAKSHMSYDSLTKGGLTYAAAIKAADPTALVTGPVISNWDKFFISELDQFQGYTVSPYCQYDNETDYQAHGGVPLVEYYLQQFAAAEKTSGTRLLDYVDLHTYFAAQGDAFGTEGSTAIQNSRLDSTRALWDPTYLDPNKNYVDVIPSSTNDPCGNPTQLPPMLIPRVKGWVARDYPGTKVAFTEYNWGGLESMNGALAQADILGIFGREGLDMAMLWAPPTPVPTTTSPTGQLPGVAAFQFYTNYDGNGSKFGDTALTSVSTNGAGSDGENYLAVYGAQRSSDKAITVIVINKGPADQTTTLSLLNTTASGNATSYQFTPANLKAIVAGPTFPITSPVAPSKTSTITGTFPAQSITLLIIPQ